MRLLSHLNTKEYPFHIPHGFSHAFLMESVTLNFDPFSPQTETPFVTLQGMKSTVAYSLNESLAKTFKLKSYHSNVVAKASESPPEADAQYIIAPFSNLSPIFQGKQHIGIQTADCLAVVFCFENKDCFIGAVSHAGWRGYSTGILQNTIEKLKQEASLVGISSEELLFSLKIHIAPAIFGVSYESGEETKEALSQHGKMLFLNYPEMSHFLELYHELMDVRQDGGLSHVVDRHLLHNQQSGYLSGKIFPDLQLLAALECFVSGVQQGNIEILRENTYSHPALFSFREATHKKSNNSLRQWTHLRFPSMDE
jgi:polyphenol oxidase